MSATMLRDKITTTIDASSETVKDEVVKHFVDIEIKRRTKLVIDGLTKLSTAEAELAKIKSDHMVFGDDGKPIQQGWTAAQKGKRDKARQLVERIDVALTTAITDADFKKLEEVLKDGRSGEGLKQQEKQEFD